MKDTQYARIEPSTSEKTVADFHHLYKNHGYAREHQPQRELFPDEKLEKEGAGKSQLSGENDDACGEPVFHPDILQEVAHSWQELVS